MDKLPFKDVFFIGGLSPHIDKSFIKLERQWKSVT
jgi:hypothetical protein